MTEPMITVFIEGTFDMSVDQVFPDGAPDPITLDDVVAAVGTANGVERLMSEWCLRPEVSAGLRRPGTPLEHRVVWP